MFRLAKLLVAVDFSETSERALDYAVELARPFNAEIHVVHVYQVPVYGFPDGAYVPAADTATQLANAAQQMLDQTVGRHVARGLTIKAHLREGIPRKEVNRLAKELGADMIVVGTHGRRGVTRALLGSVAENVIRQAEVPVLAIREAE